MQPWENLTSLPQSDPMKLKREADLTLMRQKFSYDQSVLAGVPLSKSVPKESLAGPEWNLQLLKTSYAIRRNWERLIKEEQYKFEKELPQLEPSELATMLLEKDLVGLLAYCDPDLGVALTEKRPESFRSYEKLFKKLESSKSFNSVLSDTDFADYFTCGLNPVLVRSIDRIPEKLNYAEDLFHSHLLFKDDNLTIALSEGRIFLVDYELLSALEPGSHPDQPKHVYAPIVLLALPKGSRNLEVLGVQCGQNGAEYPFFTPQSNLWSWIIAKTIVKVADINYHEVATHLCLTHLVIEPIVIATFRQLSTKHPVHKLLTPHFEGTIPINALAIKRLISKGGKVEQLATSKLESAYFVIQTVRKSFDFRQAFLKVDLEKRGVSQESLLKEYPYRDDALLIWMAIENWVTSYIHIFYATDDDVNNDYELMKWSEEIENPQLGAIKGFTPVGGLSSRKCLIETLTMIIFTASAQHAAVNFPQKEAAFVPYQPLSGYAPAPLIAENSHAHTEKDAAAFLPPLDRAIKQTHTLTLLGNIYYTQLGQYKPFAFDDPAVLMEVLKFTEELRRIERVINTRNSIRRTSYEHLKPSKIPQSINI